jgi:hypothetical protein
MNRGELKGAESTAAGRESGVDAVGNAYEVGPSPVHKVERKVVQPPLARIGLR